MASNASGAEEVERGLDEAEVLRRPEMVGPGQAGEPGVGQGGDQPVRGTGEIAIAEHDEHRNPDRSAAINSTASSTHRSTLACVITGVAACSRFDPENPDSSQAISTTAPATASTGGSPP